MVVVSNLVYNMFTPILGETDIVPIASMYGIFTYILL